jgi:adenosylcobinamide amidohydrolase
MPARVKLDIELSDQFLGDVLTTAVESGGHAMWYWEGFSMKDCMRYHADRPNSAGGTVLDDLTVTTVKFLVDHPQESDEYIVDFLDLATGIQWLLDGTVPVNDYIKGMVYRAVAQADAGEIDADAADCIVQATAFKEVVFG